MAFQHLQTRANVISIMSIESDEETGEDIQQRCDAEGNAPSRMAQATPKSKYRNIVPSIRRPVSARPGNIP